MEARKQAIMEALTRFARQRPGLEFGNYGDWKAYRAELRGITKDLAQATTLLNAVAWRDTITADDLIKAADGAFSGRLTITEKDGKPRIAYSVGQYWPTEYRRAVCAVLASALWNYTREHAMPAGTLHHNSETGETLTRYRGMRAGDWLRAYFRKEFGRGIASRWFN